MNKLIIFRHHEQQLSVEIKSLESLVFDTNTLNLVTEVNLDSR